MLDTAGRVVSWSPGAERIKGYREDEILGAHLSVFFTHEDVANGKPARELELAATDGRFEDEAWRVRKDGSRFWVNVVISAIRDSSGRLVGFTKVTRDLTERRKIEEGRVRLAQAREAVRLRDEFLSIASHELKTPLRALQLQLEGALDRVSSVDEKVATKIEKATRASDRLADLIETLLDVSRIATGRVTLNVDLVDAARDVIERVGDAGAKAGCDVALEGCGAIIGTWDRLRVEQILMNLLANAFKYAAGSPVRVLVLRTPEAALLEVKDRGPGLRDSDLVRIFARFERASSAAYAGLGLGLYIACQMAEAHGGTISARNREGGGACFSVRLPLAVPANTSDVPQ